MNRAAEQIISHETHSVVLWVGTNGWLGINVAGVVK